MYVIGTAGHVDHGKSALIEALTGIQPDRLREELERGLTIELGFAWTTLPSGREVSMVDVPGHVRFVRHMLAGIGAVDLALLVIAADEGVMPQTREHLAILDLLDVRHGIVVLTKIDLVEPEWLEFVADDVEQALAGTALAGAPQVHVSSVTREGIDTLAAMIDSMLDDVPEPADLGRPRLGIDRVFTMPGFGTVVTGTLLDGSLHQGDTVEITPGGRSARIRGLQTHRRAVETATPGTRVAVNLTGVDMDEVDRGQVLARPGRMSHVRAFDAQVRVLPGQAIRHDARVHVHIGSAEVQGRVRVMGQDAITAEGSDAPVTGWVQVLLRDPAGAVVGDLFVLRISDQTLGGGRIIEVNPARHRRSDPGTIELMERRAEGSPEERVLAALAGLEPAPLDRLATTMEADAADVREVVEALIAEDQVRQLDPGPGGAEPLLMTASGLDRVAGQVAEALDAFHREQPLRFFMPREELRSRLRLQQREFNALIGALADRFAITGGRVARQGWAPELAPAQQRDVGEIVEALEAGAFAPPRLSIDRELLVHLEQAGLAVDCGDGVVLSREHFDEARARVAEALRGQETITLAEVRDLLQTNRRVTQAFLETLDAHGVTRRRGDLRFLAEPVST